MKRLLALVLGMCLLAGCAAPAAQQPEQKQYTATFLDVFDTVTTIIGRAESEEAFQKKVQEIHENLKYYHELFDIYNTYEGINNLKTVNDNAGIAPVKVPAAIIDLLEDCIRYYEMSDGKVNVAMGAVLKLWHEARDRGINDPANAKLPDGEALQEAAEHTDIGCLVIDKKAGTVYLSDPEASLDMGAIAKGWATQAVSLYYPNEGILISVGGNVCATGPKLPDGTPWVIGIQDPDQTDKNLHTVCITEDSVVTSGDYQRTYYVDGKAYHHIIDPQTLMPSTLWRSVSVVCNNSGMADALSTALFLMDHEEGMALADSYSAKVLWVDHEGREFMTPSFEKILRT